MQQVDFRIIGEKYEHAKIDGEWKPIGNSEHVVKRITDSNAPKTIDTETTGLKWGQHEIFSIALKVDGQVYYTNFQEYPFDKNLNPDFVVKNKSLLLPIFEKPATWIAHNLKFDYHMLREFGFKLYGDLYDTMIVERLLSNDEFRYNLDSCVKRNLPGHEKDDAVETYIEKYGLYNLEEVKGKKQPFKNKYYYMVPFGIIAPYAAMDVDITQRLYQNQQVRIKENIALHPRNGPKLPALIEMESKLLQVCCDIEERGVGVDRQFCNEGLLYENERAETIEQNFRKTYGRDFVDSAKELSPLFRELGHEPPKTEKNNSSVASDFLETVSHPLAAEIIAHRDAHKRADTYFQTFLNLSVGGGIIHPDMKQSGTRTGRFSYSDPNLQNIPAEDESPFPIRRSLIPRPGHFFFMPDYNQMEFRMMLDYAGQMDLIEKILAGHDPHQATADLTGLARKPAKTLNFGLLYGMGIQKLANALGISYDEAKSFKWTYFGKLSKVKDLIYTSTDVAKSRKAVYTWAGRKLDFKNPDFCYKAINGIIQGGCADVVKMAMVHLHEALRDKGTQMIMQVHDELLFEMPYDEVGLIPMIKDAMEKVYPYRHLPLTVGLSYSLESFHDAIEADSIEGIEAAVRAYAKEQGEEPSRITPQHLVHENSRTNH